MDEDLFLALLALDSYNRGTGAGLAGLPSTGGFGSATLLAAALPPGAEAAGFVATVYSWNGKTVISYRGTDTSSTGATWADIWSGWTAGAGFATSAQGGLAMAFYQDVTGNPLYADSAPGVLLTGHSLGGGLAGLVSALSGANAVLFDHMPFGVAAELQELQAGDGFLAQTGLPRGYYVGGEPLELVRSGVAQGGLGALLSLFPIVGLGFASLGAMTAALEIGVDKTRLETFDANLGPVQKHSQALLVTLLFGQNQWLAEGVSSRTADWQAAAKHFLPSLYKDAIGTSLGRVTGDAATATGTASPADQMMRAIAYSAINEGTRVFGDTGIRAMFDDASDLGKALQPGMSASISRSARALLPMVTQPRGRRDTWRHRSNRAFDNPRRRHAEAVRRPIRKGRSGGANMEEVSLCVKR